MKEEMCSCLNCYDGDVVRCSDISTGKKGRIILNCDNECSSSDEDEDRDDEPFPEDDVEESFSDMEENELFFTHTDFSSTIEEGNYIAIHSNERASDPFYLCKGFI